MPFFRAGVSDGGGALLDRSISTGVGYKLKEKNDFIGLGLNWGRTDQTIPWPSRDQYTAEIYYRKNVSGILQIVPSAQFVVNPANLPEAHSGWILGVRMRAVF